MKKIFSTDGIASNLRFHSFREALHELNGVHVEISRATRVPFDAAVTAAQLGSVRAVRRNDQGVLTEITAETARKHDLGDVLELRIQLQGTSTISQVDREAVLQPGDMSILTWQQVKIETSAGCDFLRLCMPRRSIEDSLGTARLFSALNIPSDLGSTSLVRSCFTDLIKVHETLDGAIKDRLVSAGLELITASISERMARDPPKSMQAALTMMRAKAFVEQNLPDPTLDASQLAAAMGISLRWLQVLFRDHGYYVSDWIWARRLARARRYLCDRARAHLQIGQIAYDCGFVNQAHFSRRFRDQFGLTPRDFRQQCLSAAA